MNTVQKAAEYDARLPGRNIIQSAKVASYFRRGEEFGGTMDGFAIDMACVRNRKHVMVTGLVDIHLTNFKESGAELIVGSGKFIGSSTIEVGMADGKTRQLSGINVIMGTGTLIVLFSSAPSVVKLDSSTNTAGAKQATA